MAKTTAAWSARFWVSLLVVSLADELIDEEGEDLEETISDLATMESAEDSPLISWIVH